MAKPKQTLAQQIAADKRAMAKDNKDYAASRARAYATSKAGKPKPKIGGNTRNLKT